MAEPTKTSAFGDDPSSSLYEEDSIATEKSGPAGIKDCIEAIRLVGARKVAEFRSNSAVTITMCEAAVKMCNDITESVVDCIEDMLIELLSGSETPETADMKGVFMSQIKQLKRPLDFLSSDKKQQDFFESLGCYVAPVEYSFGGPPRYEQYLDAETGRIKHKRVENRWYYIPIFKTLEVFLSQENAADYLRFGPSEGDFIEDFMGGDVCRNNPLLSNKSKKTLALEFYADDLEIANPIGSKNTLHKVTIFYYTIRNLPPYFLSSMDNIHVAAIAHSQDVRTFGSQVILQKFAEEIIELETKGFEITVRDTNVLYYGTLAMTTADNLARNELLGMVQGFNANYFCSTCFGYKGNMQEKLHEDDFPLRSDEQYREQLELVLSGKMTKSECGIDGPCAFSKTLYWSVPRNYYGDLMHDLLEGVGPLEVKLVLHSLCTVKKYFTLQYLNARISSYPIGQTDRKNRPSAISSLDESTHGLRQKAMQFHCLLRLLPLMLGDKVPLEDEHWEFLLELRNLSEILFSGKWSHELAISYKHQWATHQRKFKALFPGENLIPKHASFEQCPKLFVVELTCKLFQHLLGHYGTFAVQTGPPAKTSTSSKELKFTFFKRSGQVVCNFKNICFTLSKRHQMFASFVTLSGRWNKDRIELEGETATASIETLPNPSQIRAAIGLEPEESAITTSLKVAFRGQSYKGLFVNYVIV